MAMQKYTVDAALTLPKGTSLKLTKEQATLRAHRLKAIGKGVYTALDEIQFKHGEVIEIDAGVLPRMLQVPLAPPVAPPGTVDTSKPAAPAADAPMAPLEGV